MRTGGSRSLTPMPAPATMPDRASDGSPQHCPICCFEDAPFAPGGRNGRPRAMCPQCRSLERHRLVWLFLTTETDLLLTHAPQRLLHLAPEPSLERELARFPQVAQLTADIDPSRVMVRMDITDIEYPDGSFEAVYCSHVLEHVPDDRRALRELFRVLVPGGWAILQVPVWREKTDEDPSITDEEERTRRFGQDDHVRQYGRLDYPRRIAEAGFQVTVDAYPRRVGQAAVERFGLTPLEEIYFARKPPAGEPGSVSWPLSAAHARTDGVVGRVERIADGVITGWAWPPGRPELRLGVRALIDEADAGGDVADRPREGLRAAGIGDGRHAFRIALAKPGASPGPHHLRIEAEGGYSLAPSSGFTAPVRSSRDPWYVVDLERRSRPVRQVPRPVPAARPPAGQR